MLFGDLLSYIILIKRSGSNAGQNDNTCKALLTLSFTDEQEE